MQHIPEAIALIPSVLSALNDNPSGSVVLVSLSGLAVAALALLRRG